jgi:hypothetical protein
MSTRNLPGGKGRPARGADNLTAICEPLSIKCGSLDVSQSYGPLWPVTGIALLFYLYLDFYYYHLAYFLLLLSFLFLFVFKNPRGVDAWLAPLPSPGGPWCQGADNINVNVGRELISVAAPKSLLYPLRMA